MDKYLILQAKKEKKQIIVMDLCSATFRSFVVQRFAKIAELKPPCVCVCVCVCVCIYISQGDEVILKCN